MIITGALCVMWRVFLCAVDCREVYCAVLLCCVVCDLCYVRFTSFCVQFLLRCLMGVIVHRNPSPWLWAEVMMQHGDAFSRIFLSDIAFMGLHITPDTNTAKECILRQ